jgi:hypothetical protein
MATQTTTGTTFEVLAPYLPYGIELQNPQGQRSKLIRLDIADKAEGILVEAGYVGKPCLCLPVLLPFSALCTPLEDGAVPAVRVIELERGGPYDYERYSVRLNDRVLWLNAGFGWRSVISIGDFECQTLSALTAQYLRSLHFAVGLEPSQYVEKSAAPAAPAIEKGAPAND